jgi:hypothetical protein
MSQEGSSGDKKLEASPALKKLEVGDLKGLFRNA